MTLSVTQAAAARLLRIDRPTTIPGTNVILSDTARAEWYSKVMAEMQRLGVNTPELTHEFCNVAGVPD